MYCVGCGAALQAGEGFCGSCGRPSGITPTRTAPQGSRLARNQRLLGILWLALSAFRLIPGIAIFTIFGNSALSPFERGDIPEFAIAIIQIVGYCFIAFAGAGFIAGWGLLTSQLWARILAIVLGAVSLVDIPFGTSIGIYTLWVLLPAESEAEYRELAASVA
jgi:hypothetical protein